MLQFLDYELCASALMEVQKDVREDQVVGQVGRQRFVHALGRFIFGWFLGVDMVGGPWFHHLKEKCLRFPVSFGIVVQNNFANWRVSHFPTA